VEIRDEADVIVPIALLEEGETGVPPTLTFAAAAAAVASMGSLPSAGINVALRNDVSPSMCHSSTGASSSSGSSAPIAAAATAAGDAKV
jgi:hypothetical protein